MTGGTSERRNSIMKTLCRRRHETIRNLAFEFGVSERTIKRDIEVLSLNEPIYTQPGRYGGGVYIDRDYSMSRMYMTEEETDVLRKLSGMADKQSVCDLNDGEIKTLRSVISVYEKPKTEKRKRNIY